MNFNNNADWKKLLFVWRIYLVWIFISIAISVFWYNNIADLYFDLPLKLRNVPRFFISLAYLIFFVPPFLAAIIMAIAVVAFVIGRWK